MGKLHQKLVADSFLILVNNPKQLLGHCQKSETKEHFPKTEINFIKVFEKEQTLIELHNFLHNNKIFSILHAFFVIRGF